MKIDKELICPYSDKVLCVDLKYVNQKHPKPQYEKECNKCCWGPEGESIMAARLQKQGYEFKDGKWLQRRVSMDG